MTKAELAIAHVLDGLPEELTALIEQRVRFVVRARPTPLELELGIGADWRGAFLGLPVTDDPEADEARGTVLLYTDNCRSGTVDELEQVVLHELHHFLGADEDEVDAEGVGAELGGGLAEVRA